MTSFGMTTAILVVLMVMNFAKILEELEMLRWLLE